jgi:hypothetical protein
MNKKLSLIFLNIFAICIMILTSCGFIYHDSDSELVQKMFPSPSPGYSNIKILDQEGDNTGSHPRVLTLQVTMDVYPNPVVCEGQIIHFRGDPSYIDFRWFTLEGAGLSSLIGLARSAITKSHHEPNPFQTEHVSILLKHWIDERLIKLDDIQIPEIHKQVNDFITNSDNIPPGVSNVSLFDSSRIQTHDLAPDLPANKKQPTYVLRKDGTIDLYISNDPYLYLHLPSAGFILPTPIPTPFKGVN